tara:strand:- start:49 stop:564 length:516 start_codon:yes stop_codon:yes gene_type:complete
MKLLIENWRKFMTEEQKLNQLSDFIGKYEPGMIRLFHFTRAPDDTEEIMIDPQFFVTSRGSYSKNEWNKSSFPRSFFYTDLNNIEGNLFSSSKLFYGDVQGSDIYDFKNDINLEDYYMQAKHPQYNYVDWTKLFKLISESYKGMYYTLGPKGPPIVVYFEPLKVKIISKEE